MSSPHPLAYIEAILLAGAYTVACIAGYFTAAVIVSAVIRWRRRARARRQAALGAYVAARQAAARRDPLEGIVVNAEFERIAAQLHYDSVRDMLDDGDDAA